MATEKVGEVIVGLSLSVRTSETVMRFTCGETGGAVQQTQANTPGSGPGLQSLAVGA